MKNKDIITSLEFEKYEKLVKMLNKFQDEILSSIESEVEGLRQNHKVFECNGTHKYEDWCEDENCPSQDAKKIKANNQAIDKVLAIINNHKSK